MFLLGNSRAEKINQRGPAKPQYVVPDSRRQSAASFEICQIIELSRTRRLSYLGGMVSKTESSNWPCLGSVPSRGICGSVRPVHKLSGLRFHAPWIECGFSYRTCFSSPHSIIVVTLLELSRRPLLRLRLRGGVADGSMRSKHTGLDDARLSKPRESVGVIEGKLPSFLSPVSSLLTEAGSV